MENRLRTTCLLFLLALASLAGVTATSGQPTPGGGPPSPSPTTVTPAKQPDSAAPAPQAGAPLPPVTPPAPAAPAPAPVPRPLPVPSAADRAKYLSRLDRWFRGGPSGKTCLLVGDSTSWQIDGIITTATAVVSDGVVTSIGNITNPTGGPLEGGRGRTWANHAPLIYLSGGGGSGATATATVVADAITGFTITNGGHGYSSAPIVSFGSYWFARFQAADGPLHGATFVNFGENGCSLQAWLADSVVHGISATIAAAPDLIIFDYLTNDVRLGRSSQPQMEALMVQAMQRLRSALPHVCIVLRMPAPFLTTDLYTRHFVSPNDAAQAYSDAIAQTYRNVADRWGNVVLCDTHALVFGETSLAASPDYLDQIHQSPLGYAATADALVSIIATPSASREVSPAHP